MDTSKKTVMEQNELLKKTVMEQNELLKKIVMEQNELLKNKMTEQFLSLKGEIVEQNLSLNATIVDTKQLLEKIMKETEKKKEENLKRLESVLVEEMHLLEKRNKADIKKRLQSLLSKALQALMAVDVVLILIVAIMCTSGFFYPASNLNQCDASYSQASVKKEKTRVVHEKPPIMAENPPSVEEKQPPPIERYNEQIESIVSRYAISADQTRIVLLAAGETAFGVPSPRKPTILIVFGKHSDAKCFANDVSRTVAHMYRIENLQKEETSISLRVSDAATAKLTFRAALEEKLSIYHTATVLSFDELQGEAPLVLHDFCDHDHAPFKNSFIILTIDGEIDERECNEETVFARLRHRWINQNQLEDYKVEPVLSRLGSFVVCLPFHSNIVC